ncbi:Hypothetical predicted protein [Lecanosticta acicola]|uniref:Arb2 domain-containing protein n=1 Tax=Lecanosticta acicola TaxID=111012 RepID=A0AAI8W1L7_9PEZI|nr:Hypothetical predicted protein [Lecanosticta acicola]
MFRSLHASAEPRYEAVLDKLGFEYKDGQFRHKIDGSLFGYYYSIDERDNDMRKEAMHEAIRKEVARLLTSQYNIQEQFLDGVGGRNVGRYKPTGPHVTILCTEVSQLRKKRDIVVVIGDSGGGSSGSSSSSGQDAGIWAWRVVTGEGGTEEGTALGLAAKIAAYGQSRRTDDFDKYQEIEKGMAKLPIQDEDTTPGLIILNPGQLLYSWYENKAMTQQTWRNRASPEGISEGYEIDPKHNLVSGHQDNRKHIVTMLEHVIPYMVNDEARVNIMAVGDSCSHVVDHLDHSFLNGDEGISKYFETLALVEPDWLQEPELGSEKLQNHLVNWGRCWIESETKPFGSLVNHPLYRSTRPVIEYAPGTRSKADHSDDPQHSAFSDDSADDSDSGSAPHSETNSPVERRDSTEPLDETPPDASPVLHAPPPSLARSEEEIPTEYLDEEKAGLEPTYHRRESSKDDKVFVFNEEGEMIDKTDEVLNASAESEAVDASIATVDFEDPDTVEEVTTVGLPTDENDKLIDEPEPPADFAICPTFSAGYHDGISELVFPAVLDHVLEFFWEVKKETEQLQADVARANAEK